MLGINVNETDVINEQLDKHGARETKETKKKMHYTLQTARRHEKYVSQFGLSWKRFAINVQGASDL